MQKNPSFLMMRSLIFVDVSLTPLDTKLNLRSSFEYSLQFPDEKSFLASHSS